MSKKQKRGNLPSGFSDATSATPYSAKKDSHFMMPNASSRFEEKCGNVTKIAENLWRKSLTHLNS